MVTVMFEEKSRPVGGRQQYDGIMVLSIWGGAEGRRRQQSICERVVKGKRVNN